MSSKEELKKKQVEMHYDIIKRIGDACAAGCYYEAVFLEYAAIEGRLEVIMGLLGMPCNKDLSAKIRKDIKIYFRIECLSEIYQKENELVLQKTKLEADFFKGNEESLSSWIKDRNILVHGLSKDARKYFERQEICQRIAKRGQDIVRKLYNEAKRIKKVVEKVPDVIYDGTISCPGNGCKADPNVKEK